MANRNWASAGKIYSMRAAPVLIDCNFIVDSTNANGLGIRSLKGPCVRAVYMHTTAPLAGSGNPNPTSVPSGGGPPPGSPDLGTAITYNVLASSSITNTGFSVLDSDLGLYPGTSVTGFPPGIVNGTQHITDSAAQNAEIDATAAYTYLQGLAPGTAITAGGSGLDALVLLPGTYTSASTMGLSVGATLTLDAAGDPDAIWIFQVGSAVTFNSGSTVTIINGGNAANVYWQVGSSATLGTTSTVLGTFIANSSVSLLTGASLEGRALALTGSVTLDTNAMTLPTFPLVDLGSGVIIVQLEDNYSRYISDFKAVVSPVSGAATKIDNSALTAGVAYTISTLGSSTEAQWHALGLAAGVTPAVGVTFIANSVGAGANTSTSRVMTSASGGSNIATLEMIGDANMSIAPDPTKNQGFGAQFMLQARNYDGDKAAPVDGTLISLSFLLDNSGVRFQRE